ncbi:hypothetical protein OHB12_01740 [Nocardia sp. NBC_01730]|uniref:hypothetical protein n=1 Tax=Nocardia sp. NBC_01730 TaxID=2975998 RepID=UPI002E0F9512|nr:hypothetical protein OHB12_01740 [Nocardia sp. NBC_01730]
MAAQLHELTGRATRAGYHPVRGSSAPYVWELVDAEDGAPILSASRLEQIEQWLDS